VVTAGDDDDDTDYAGHQKMLKEKKITTCAELAASDATGAFTEYNANMKKASQPVLTRTAFDKVIADAAKAAGPAGCGGVGFKTVDGKQVVQYYTSECVDGDPNAAAFTSSSLAALFGVLCVSLTLW